MKDSLTLKVMMSVGLLAAFAVGFVVRGASGNTNPSLSVNGNSAEVEQKYQSAADKLKQLSEIDIQEYLQLKSQKEKYEKADEIMSKILMLMISDFGLKNPQGQLSALKGGGCSNDTKNPVGQCSLTGEAGGGASGAVASTPSLASSAAVSDTIGNTPVSAMGTPSRDFVAKGTKAADLTSEKDVKDFLDSVEIKDLMSELKDHQAISVDQMKLLNGKFVGTISQLLNGKAAVWKTEMDFNGTFDGKNVGGTYEIQLWNEKGKRFSHTTGSAEKNDKNFMAFKGDPNALLINIYGDDGFLQLYYITNLNQFSGNYYAKKGYEGFEKTGYVTLRKLN